jgi:succinate dehydrogenase/fumarate reductase flavoprotein subunit
MAENEKITRRDIIATGAAAGAAMAGGMANAPATSAQTTPIATAIEWHREVDVVVIGTGASGFPAAVAAREGGASVIMIEAEPHVGGHASVSGGHLPLGGGTSIQKAAGVDDSPDKVFDDLTDWTVVQPNGFPDYRYNDREVIRAFADNSAPTLEFLLRHGVKFTKSVPDGRNGSSHGNSGPRQMHVAIMDWPLVKNGRQVAPEIRQTFSSGNGLIQPLHTAAHELGVEILLEHRMTAIHRETPRSGAVLGVEVAHNGQVMNIRARKAVFVGTGGSTGNVNFRRMFDPRLTEEYCGLAGMPYSDQDASGELAGMAIGASLWGFYNQVGEFGSALDLGEHIGCQYSYGNLKWEPGAPVFDKARASGLRVNDYQNVILVNMLGQRFYDETAGSYSANRYGRIQNYTPYDYRNARDIVYNPQNLINAMMAGIRDGHNGGGPIWAIFDQDAVERQDWDPTPPNVDFAEGFFYRADTLAELAQSIKIEYQRVPMPPETLEATVARYNSFVDKGVDEDFEKPNPRYKIQRPPFYCAWSTPVIHDTRAGLRINGKSQVVDVGGEIIPGLYCGGESAGGFSMHGLARATCQGFIAGSNMVLEPTRS